MGGAIFLPVGQNLFANQILHASSKEQATTILAAGATELRHTFSATDLPGTLRAYMTGLKWTFAMAAMLSGITLPIAFASKWPVFPRRHQAATESD